MTRIDPKQYPLNKGEHWRIVHPNDGNVEFAIPQGAATVCRADFFGFERNMAYDVRHGTEGWVVVGQVEMPEYLFKRYFDSECFVRGRRPLTAEELEKATPFDYRPTLPQQGEWKDTDGGE